MGEEVCEPLAHRVMVAVPGLWLQSSIKVNGTNKYKATNLDEPHFGSGLKQVQIDSRLESWGVQTELSLVIPAQ